MAPPVTDWPAGGPLVFGYNFVPQILTSSGRVVCMRGMLPCAPPSDRNSSHTSGHRDRSEIRCAASGERRRDGPQPCDSRADARADDGAGANAGAVAAPGARDHGADGRAKPMLLTPPRPQCRRADASRQARANAGAHTQMPTPFAHGVPDPPPDAHTGAHSSTGASAHAGAHATAHIGAHASA